MSNSTLNQNRDHNHELSALDRLNLSFEYNVSWADEKRSIKERALS